MNLIFRFGILDKSQKIKKIACNKLYSGNTESMKTAISIPDDLFYSAENTAKRLGIPRSQLFAKALEEFIRKHSKERITEKLNNIYPDQTVNSLSEISVNKLRDSLKHDSW